MTPTLYLHWTATPYDWIRPGHYHSIISGDGRVHRLHDYNVDLPAHTYGRNRNSVALSCACMGGVPDPWTQPPTDAQLSSLCAEAAAVARSWGWGADQITVERVMTHAEAASNRDGRWMHDNYGPVIWGGTGERWDLLQLSKNGAIDGGEQLRRRIQALLRESDRPLEQERLAPSGAPRPFRPEAVSSWFSWMPWAAPGPWPPICWSVMSCRSPGMQASVGCSSVPWMSVQRSGRTAFRPRWAGRCLRCRFRAAQPR